jgi:hypothetical protein
LRFRYRVQLDQGVDFFLPVGTKVAVLFLDKDHKEFMDPILSEFLFTTDFQSGKTNHCEKIIDVKIPPGARAFSIQLADSLALTIQGFPIPPATE